VQDKRNRRDSDSGEFADEAKREVSLGQSSPGGENTGNQRTIITSGVVAARRGAESVRGRFFISSDRHAVSLHGRCSRRVIIVPLNFLTYDTEDLAHSVYRVSPSLSP